MKSNHKVGAVVGAWVLVATMATASAETQTLCTLSPSTGVGLHLNGVAAWMPNGGLRLVPNLLDQSGSVFQAAPVPFPAGTSFHAAFSFQMAPRVAGADGIGFVLQSSPAGAAALGGDARGLGYQFVPDSVIVEFDTYRNHWDINSNHVALMVGGDPSNHLALGTPPFALTVGVDYAWVDYDGVAKQVAIFVSQSPTKPASPLVSSAIDYGLHVGAQAFVGFTAATGHDTNNHDLLTWEFSTDGVPCACLGPSACGPTTPVCGAAGLCVQCATDADCQRPTARCATDPGVCVACLSDADCGGATSVCNPTSSTCGEPADAGLGDAGSGETGGAGGSPSGAGSGGTTGVGGAATTGAGGSDAGSHGGSDGGHGSGGASGWSSSAEPNSMGRCACRTGPHPAEGAPFGGAALLGLVAWSRRRRRERRAEASRIETARRSTVPDQGRFALGNVSRSSAKPSMPQAFPAPRGADAQSVPASGSSRARVQVAASSSRFRSRSGARGSGSRRS